MRANKKCRALAGITFVIAFAAVFAATTALAQQGRFIPPPSPSTNLKSQNGSVLEVPTMPGRQGGTATLPQITPGSQGGELTLPSHELRRQPGYEQVTVTVTDQQGRYVTGLRKNDFRLYIDGQQRPIDFFRQDMNTPVSVGVLVDTSGSMAPKIVQAQTAISLFLKELNDQDDVFLFAFSSKPFLLQKFTTNHYLVM
ncbi:MAG TPA: VWA domain-containing protein, partial [Candidatus Binataceae bacterium]|nr:VWA domain-containing protein [Candidatus Binataceae bacterium]